MRNQILQQTENLFEHGIFRWDEYWNWKSSIGLAVFDDIFFI